MTKFLRGVANPIAAAVLGSVLTLLAVGPQAQTVEPTAVEVRVIREPLGFPDELIREVRVVERVCDTATAVAQLNEVLRSRAESGEAGTGNSATRSAHQAAEARSGDAILGQVIDIIALCSTVDLDATNTVTDSEARTGDASAENRADLDGPSSTEPPAPATSTSKLGPSWSQSSPSPTRSPAPAP